MLAIPWCKNGERLGVRSVNARKTTRATLFKVQCNGSTARAQTMGTKNAISVVTKYTNYPERHVRSQEKPYIFVMKERLRRPRSDQDVATEPQLSRPYGVLDRRLTAISRRFHWVHCALSTLRRRSHIRTIVEAEVSAVRSKATRWHRNRIEVAAWWYRHDSSLQSLQERREIHSE